MLKPSKAALLLGVCAKRFDAKNSVEGSASAIPDVRLDALEPDEDREIAWPAPITDSSNGNPGSFGTQGLTWPCSS